MKIKKGDNVKIISGKDRDKTGKVLKVFRESEKILVERINMFKKHVRPKKQGEKGETVEIPKPIAASNVMLVCSSCKKTTRIGAKIEGEAKSRICRRCGSKI